MSGDLIFYPVFVQALLTLVMYVRLSQVKSRALRAGQVDKTRRALHDDAWPESVIQVGNNVRNQFELPVLFYAVCFVLWALEAVGVIALVTAWLFVASRIAHAWIHVTSNRVMHRRRVFTVGWWILVAMTLLAAWQLVGRALV